jgi:N-acetylneuraminate synthase
MSVFVIAEAGVNHNGNIDIAKRLIDCAVSSGADAVKFQTFVADLLVTKTAKQASYQEKNTNRQISQYQMLKELELSFDAYQMLSEYCKEVGIEFMSTAFDSLSLKFLTQEIGLNRLKIPSGDITNAPFLFEHARTGADLILSTGMSTISEIRSALSVIALGYAGSGILTGRGEIPILDRDEIQAQLAEKVVLLHCTTEYPAPLETINLKAIGTLSEEFGLPVGYSDHSEGDLVSIAAVAQGAQVIEKHFTLDREMEGPDHKASMEPQALRKLITSIREVEIALGDGIKAPLGIENQNKEVARKSLVAAATIKKGEPLTEDNMAVKRPGTGVSPFEYWSMLNMKAHRDYAEGELLEKE